MMKREVIRILVAAGIGVIVALVWAYRSDSVCWEMLLLPFYFVGTFYAGSVLFKLIGGVLKTYFSGQFTSLLMNPLWGNHRVSLIPCAGTWRCACICLVIWNREVYLFDCSSPSA